MGFSFWQLLIILLIAVVLFGSRRLRTLGSDLGDAIGGFRRSMSSNDEVTHERVTDAREKPERV